jgi:SAM-dependent methyltransferase
VAVENTPLGAVRDFWDAGACGEVYAQGTTVAEQCAAQACSRYALEPYILPFARVCDGRERDVLEVGVGMGADHARWASSKPRHLVGVDLTPRALEWTRRRLQIDGTRSDLMLADAEALPFADDSFDIVYSWGVLHHTPGTEQAFSEVRRVLRRGGTARVMIYHRPSIVGWLLWARYGLLAGRPGRRLTDVYAEHMESPGTKGFTVEEAGRLVSAFAQSRIRVQLSFGDLLQGRVGQRHASPVLDLAKRIWPRRAITRLLPSCGMMLLIEAVK